jgi:hypothetical protein
MSFEDPNPDSRALDCGRVATNPIRPESFCTTLLLFSVFTTRTRIRGTTLRVFLFVLAPAIAERVRPHGALFRTISHARALQTKTPPSRDPPPQHNEIIITYTHLHTFITHNRHISSTQNSTHRVHFADRAPCEFSSANLTRARCNKDSSATQPSLSTTQSSSLAHIFLRLHQNAHNKHISSTTSNSSTSVHFADLSV